MPLRGICICEKYWHHFSYVLNNKTNINLLKHIKMKKVFLVAALSLGTMTAFAQEVEAVAAEVQEETSIEAVATEAIEETATEAVEETAVEAVEETATEAVEATTVEVIEAQDAFTEVAIEELPEAVTEALATDHPGTTISKAYANQDSQYKLEVAKEDGTTVELYADAEGNWIEM